ncbi:MAG: sodium:solute symporter family protein [Desulfovibrionaceae bacterium]|nr:sodium:solute symporter family protein [Desulfovibrionaceae bacterium]
MVAIDIGIWIAYIVAFVWLFRKGRGHDVMLSGKVGFSIQAFAFVATYISAVALVGFGGLAYRYGMQMLLVAAGNVWLGTWIVYRYLAWPTRVCQRNLGARTPVQLLAKGHRSPALGRCLALIFAIFLGVYASAVIKGAALLLEQIVPLSADFLVWLVALLVGCAVFVGGLRGVLYTEAMQGFVMLIGISMLIFAVFNKVGGPIQGMAQLASLPPTDAANTGFVSLASGGEGWFIMSLVIVTSVAVWAQPQMIQRHFALASPHQVDRITPLAMCVLTVLVGGAYYVASLGRLFLPEIAQPDAVMPTLVRMLLPEVGLQLFVLAIASASLSTATAIFHIAVSAVAEDLPGSPANRMRWFLGIVFIVILSAGCAQVKGQIIAILCATSWSVVGSAVLVSYVALVRFGRRSSLAAWISCAAGFVSCLLWYLMMDKNLAIFPPLFPSLQIIPPFFVGFTCSLCGWFCGWMLDKNAHKNSHFWPEEPPLN